MEKTEEKALTDTNPRSDWQIILKNYEKHQVIAWSKNSSEFSVLDTPRSVLPFTKAASNKHFENDELQVEKLSDTLKPFACDKCGRPFVSYPGSRKASFSSRFNDASDESKYFAKLSEIYRESFLDENLLDFQGATNVQDSLKNTMFNPGYFSKFFNIVGSLGRGLRGSVFKCEHMLDDILIGEYAVKIVPVGDSYNWLLKMLNEVKILEQCRHPNIIEYRHAWIEEYQPSQFGPEVPCLFILMELATLGNLEDYTHELRQRSEKLNIELIFSFVADIVRGIHHLHSLDILHRDLKPSNFLLYKSKESSFPKIMLSDFGEGLTGHYQDLNARTGATGTLEYMAPEILSQDSLGYYQSPHTKASDMWSLGVIIFELLYGKLPLQNIEDVDLLRENILNQRLEKPARSPNLSQKENILVNIIERCLIYNPNERIDIESVLLLINNALDEKPIGISTQRIDDRMELFCLLLAKVLYIC